jgi:hypothetical protein
MAKTANSYILPQDNRIKTAIVTTAKASDANLTDAVKICDAGANGSLIKKAWALPRQGGSPADSKLTLLVTDGVTTWLVDSVKLPAYTASTATATPVTTFPTVTADEPFYLQAGYSLYGATAVAFASGIAINALVEDY